MKRIIVSFGAGTNSYAMLVGLHERGIRPDAITFADTGGELPHVYAGIATVNEWCRKVGFPLVETLRGDMPQQVIDGTLEQECLRLGKLPAKAYGFSSCSDKWKMEPQRRYNVRYAKEHGIAMADITRLIGFDANEEGRVTRGRANAHKYPVREEYPLFDWDWARDECVAAIARAGLPQPGKSACFFCPSSKKPEITALARKYPVFAIRAVAMERRALAGEGPAEATTSKGLGRYFSWEQHLAGTDTTGDHGTPEIDCGCYDGSYDPEELIAYGDLA